MVEYLEGLLGESTVELFTDETKAISKFDEHCKELTNLADGEDELLEDKPDLFIKESGYWWLSSDISGLTDLLVRLSEREI